MSVLAWIILGLMAGFIASNILNRSGQCLLLDIVPGIVVVVGGFLFGHACRLVREAETAH